MTLRVREVQRWQAGEPLTARRLNESVDAIRDLQAAARPKDGGTNSPSEVDTDNEEQAAVNEVWTFVSAQTTTVRIEDESDSSIYVDVEKSTSVTVRRPDGTTVRIELE